MKDDKPIITEDGQRLTIEDGHITGTEDPGPGAGLAFETGNVKDEKDKPGNSCPVDNANKQESRGDS